MRLMIYFAILFYIFTSMEDLSEAQRYIGLVFMIGGFIYAIIYDYYWYENFRKVIKFKKTLEEKLKN